MKEIWMESLTGQTVPQLCLSLSTKWNLKCLEQIASGWVVDWRHPMEPSNITSYYQSFGFSLQADNKILLLMTTLACFTEHREVELVYISSLQTHCVMFMELEDTLLATTEEKQPAAQVQNLGSRSVTCLYDKLCNSDRNVVGVTNHFRVGLMAHPKRCM